LKFYKAVDIGLISHIKYRNAGKVKIAYTTVKIFRVSFIPIKVKTTHLRFHNKVGK